MKTPHYISASRRCDLPRFFHRRFFAAWRRGQITYDGGYGRVYTVSLRPEDVCGFIFWSKDYAHFIEQPDFHRLIEISNAVFHFTLNDCPDLEPHLPDLESRLGIMERLCNLVGYERVLWRYDPICRYRSSSGENVTTDKAFFALLPRIAQLGVRRCYFSFMSDYAKLRDRPAEFSVIGEEERARIASAMLAAAQSEGMQLYSCSNDEVPILVPGIQQAHCVDEILLRKTDRFGVHRSLTPKPTRKGCGCFESRDIGTYDPPCPHGCLYCYANPRIEGPMAIYLPYQ
jgi:hypothetical protein